MEKINSLKDAFNHFTVASKSLEIYYEKLHERLKYLTMELEKKNRQLNAALKDAEETKDYLKEILECMEEAIIVLDTDSKITMFNIAAEELFGVNSEDVIGKGFDILNVSIECQEAETIININGKKYNVILSVSDVIDSSHNLRGKVMLIKDISRLKELESQNERNHRLIAMGEMAVKIVHEIRSPLCSIELYASMLASDLSGTEHAKLAEGISSGIKSLNNILTNMLFFAKPHKPFLKEVDIAQIIEQSVFMLNPMIESRGLALNIDLPFNLFVRGDSELLKQVLLNILLNAIQITPEGKKIEIALKAEDGYVVVDIRDEGEGIDSENMERIFDPFFTTKEKGTGLGLTIASRIMQAHGGSIRVKSDKGKGSCFSLHLPFERLDVSGKIQNTFLEEYNTLKI